MKHFEPHHESNVTAPKMHQKVKQRFGLQHSSVMLTLELINCTTLGLTVGEEIQNTTTIVHLFMAQLEIVDGSCQPGLAAHHQTYAADRICSLYM